MPTPTDKESLVGDTVLDALSYPIQYAVEPWSLFFRHSSHEDLLEVWLRFPCPCAQYCRTGGHSPDVHQLQSFAR